MTATQRHRATTTDKRLDVLRDAVKDIKEIASVDAEDVCLNVKRVGNKEECYHLFKHFLSLPEFADFCQSFDEVEYDDVNLRILFLKKWNKEEQDWERVFQICL